MKILPFQEPAGGRPALRVENKTSHRSSPWLVIDYGTNRCLCGDNASDSEKKRPFLIK
jgi:hypothetical protein